MKCSRVGTEGSSGVSSSRWFQCSFCFSAVPILKQKRAQHDWHGQAMLCYCTPPLQDWLSSSPDTGLVCTRVAQGAGPGTIQCLRQKLISRCSKWVLSVMVVGVFNSCCKILGPQLLPTYSLNVLIHSLDSVMKALYFITMEGKCFLMNTGNAVGTREEQPEFVTPRWNRWCWRWWAAGEEEASPFGQWLQVP